MRCESSHADVHILLGDIGMEQEAFDGALSDFSESIKLLSSKKVSQSSCRLGPQLELLDVWCGQSTIPS